MNIQDNFYFSKKILYKLDKSDVIKIFSEICYIHTNIALTAMPVIDDYKIKFCKSFN